MFLCLKTLFDSLPNDKILDWYKLKALADDEIIVTPKLKFVLRSIENIVGKGEMLVSSTFSFTHNVFKAIFLRPQNKCDRIIEICFGKGIKCGKTRKCW